MPFDSRARSSTTSGLVSCSPLCNRFSNGAYHLIMIRYLHIPLVAFVLLLSVSSVEAQPEESPVPVIYSIEEAVQTALRRNLLFQQDSVNLESADASVRARFGAFLPSVSLRANYSKFLNEVSSVADGVELSSSRPSSDLTGGATASLQIFDGFARSASYNAAKRARESAGYQTLAHQVQVALETREAFLDVLKGRAQEELRRTELESIRTRRDQLIDRVTAGVALRVDLDAMESEIANAEYALLTATTATDVRMTRLTTALNLSPERVIDVVAGSINLRLDSISIVAILERLGEPELFREKMLEKRYDIAQKRTLLLEREQRVNVARAGYYPSVGANLGVSYYRSGPITQTSGSLGIGLQYELFDGFRTDEQVQIAESSEMSARIDLRRTELVAESNLVRIRKSLEGAGKLVDAANRGVNAARISRESALARYDAGVGSYENVLASTTRFVTARINLIDASYVWWTSYYQLVAELGYVSEP